MGLLDSILNLAFVVGAGYLTIYYIVPKITSGDWAPPGLDFSTPAANEEDNQIQDDIANTTNENEKIDLQSAWRFFS